MSAAKKKHHFVSRFYLEYFADSANLPFIWLYDKRDRTIRNAGCSDVGCQKSFYAFPKADGTTDTDTIEDIFQSLESQVAPLFRKIESREELTNQERSAVSLFLAVSHTRVPNTRAMLEAHHLQMLKELARWGHKHYEGIRKNGVAEDYDPDVASAFQMLNDGRLEIKVLPHASIRPALELADDLAPLLHEMQWVFLITTDLYPFVTSDNPFVYVDPNYKANGMSGAGLQHSHIEVTFPITSNVALFASWKYSDTVYRRVTEATVKAVNRRTVLNAERFIYASFKSDGFAKRVWQHFNRHPQPRPQVLKAGGESYIFQRGLNLEDNTNLTNLVYGSGKP